MRRVRRTGGWRRLLGSSTALTSLAAATGALIFVGCANPSPPPGGPPDPLPPVVLSVSPDSGSVDERPREVEFRFDEVVEERPSGAPTLAGLVVVSPYQGEPDVRWHRNRISVRIPGGWRDSTVYVVRLNPGITDLRRNILDSTVTTVFSTGGAIPDTHLRGAIFDWEAGRAAPLSLVEALVLRGDDTTRYVTRSDSAGRFDLGFVPSGPLVMRGVLDENRNFTVDRREAWDTTSVELADSARVELYTFVHDTVGPAASEVAVSDSVTIQVALTRPLALDQPIDTTIASLFTSDSTPVAIASVMSLAMSDSLAAALRDSIRRVDSIRVADSTAAARAAAGDTGAIYVPPVVEPEPPQLDSAARDSIVADSIRRTPPEPSRPTPVGTIVIRAAAPLAPQTRFRVQLNEVRGLDGPPRTSDRSFETPERDTTPPAPVVPDSATPDSAPPPPTGAPPDSGRSIATVRDAGGVNHRRDRQETEESPIHVALLAPGIELVQAPRRTAGPFDVA